MPTDRSLVIAALKFLRAAHPAVLHNNGSALTGDGLVWALKATAWAPVSNIEKSNFVVIAYALVCLHQADHGTLAAVRNSLVQWQPRTSEPARLFVQALHLPIDAWQDKPQQARNFYSRYAGAVKYLVSKGEKPSSALVHSGTVNGWERLYSGRNGPAVAPAPLTNLTAEFRIKQKGTATLKWTSSDPKFVTAMIGSLNKRAAPKT